MAKISLIGAGSVIFAKNLICDILQNKALEASVICLMDIDPERLRVSEILAKKVVAQLGVPARVEATLDLRKACAGARYVITMIQVGGYRPATITDFEIPKKYGLRQTIADTLGVGGVFRALRTMPELVKVGQALCDHGASDPFFLNYTNPMAMNMMAISRACGVPSVGLCHSVQGTSHTIATYAGIPHEDVTYKVAGINHVAFFLEFKYRGRDAYPLLFRAMENPRIYASDKVRFEMMRRLGYFVTESSEHFSEYCPWFIHHGSEVIKEFGIPIDEYLRRCESILTTWKKTEKRMLEDGSVSIGKSVEYGAQIINSIESGTPVVIYGNVPNTNLITNLPAGCSVEVPCLVDAQGIQPTVIGDMPPQLAAMCRSNIAVQELAVEAFLTGKREHIYHAVMMDPHTSAQLTLDQIWKMCDELIEAHQRNGFLPQFAPVWRGTGRAASDLDKVMVSIEELQASTPGQVEVVVTVQNDTLSRFQGDLALRFDSSAFRLSGRPKIPCRLAAGAVRRIPLRFRRLKPNSLLTLDVTSPNPDVFAKAYTEHRRNRFDAGADRVRMLWSGNVIAEGKLSSGPRALELKLRIPDTDITTQKLHYWDGSNIEIFFAPARGAHGQPAHLVVLPDPKHPILMAAGDRKAVPGSRVVIRSDRSGYEAAIRIPWKAARLSGKEAFLMEIRVAVNALGDAHGRVSATWQGSSEPHLQTGKFALVSP